MFLIVTQQLGLPLPLSVVYGAMARIREVVPKLTIWHSTMLFKGLKYYAGVPGITDMLRQLTAQARPKSRILFTPFVSLEHCNNGGSVNLGSPRKRRKEQKLFASPLTVSGRAWAESHTSHASLSGCVGSRKNVQKAKYVHRQELTASRAQAKRAIVAMLRRRGCLHSL